MPPIAPALRSGCGTLPKEDLPPEEWTDARRHIAGALRVGWTIQEQGGAAVDAVALDREGNLAAATSTGGFNNMPAGRVGDSPIIGAGTYARNGVCAVSGTGKGEFFIRHFACHEVASLIEYKGVSLAEATRTVVFDRIGSHRIGAGMVAVDPRGNIAAPFNTLGMYRGLVLPSGEMDVATHRDVAGVEHLFVGV